MVSEDTKSLVPKASLASTAHARHMLTSREKQSHLDTTPEKTPETGSGAEAAEQSHSVSGDVATALKVNSVDCVKKMTFNSANGKWKWKMSLLHKQTLRVQCNNSQVYLGGVFKLGLSNSNRGGLPAPGPQSLPTGGIQLQSNFL